MTEDCARNNFFPFLFDNRLGHFCIENEHVSISFTILHGRIIAYIYLQLRKRTDAGRGPCKIPRFMGDVIMCEFAPSGNPFWNLAELEISPNPAVLSSLYI